MAENKKKRLFNMDLHISVIADVETILQNLYHENIQITSWCLSDHSHILHKTKIVPDIINDTNWKQLNINMIRNFQQQYHNFLSQFDGFIVTHTPVFALLYIGFNKPIFMINSCRYEQPFSWLGGSAKMWNYLNRQLAELYFLGQLIPISNNRADCEYLRLGTGIDSHLISSLCTYTRAQWTGTKSQIVLFDQSRIISRGMVPNLYHKNELLNNNYHWTQLYQYRAIVHIPYESSTMSIFEQYMANVPLIFPTKAFMKRYIKMGKISFQSRYVRHEKRRISYPPELEPALNDATWIDFWLDRADYYDRENMKYILYFDSLPELAHILQTTNFEEVSQLMAEWNTERELVIHDKWKEIMDEHLFV